MSQRKGLEEKTFYYVDPKKPQDPVANVYCINSICVNFMNVHQTCNLKNVHIIEGGKCEFYRKRTIKKAENK